MKRKISTPEDLASALRDARHTVDISQEELSKRSGVRQATISDLEKMLHPRPINNLLRLLSALKLNFILEDQDIQESKVKDHW